MMHQFPSLDEVLEMHEALIDTFGGAHGIRDLGELDSAILRPQMGYYSSLMEDAAALTESLSNNYPFIHGNKRVAFFATDDFLQMNDFYIDCDSEAAYSLFIGLYESNSFRFANLLPWLEEHSKPLL